MAMISLQLQQTTVTKVERAGDCLAATFRRDLEGGHVYSRDWVTFHGTLAEMRDFANQILAALPSEQLIEAPSGEVLAEA
jgi:hypothetical protein